MMELTSRPPTEGPEDVICSSNPVQTFSAGPTCKLLTKNAIFQSPEDDGSVFVCAGDQASNSALVPLFFFLLGCCSSWEFTRHSIRVFWWQW